MGDVSEDAHPSAVSLNCFCTNPISRGIPYQAMYSCSAKKLLRLNDVTLSMSVLVAVLRDLSAWFSIFDTAQLTDLGSKTGYRRLTRTVFAQIRYPVASLTKPCILALLRNYYV